MQGTRQRHMATEAETEERFSVRGFRFHRQWAVDADYLRRLPPAERKWMQRFLAEYYDADNKLLRPEKHVERCRTCRQGGDCGKRPPPAIHGTDELRRECYRRQKYAWEDTYSRGRVSLWEDVDAVPTEDDGSLVRKRRNRCAEAPRWDAGDFVDESPPRQPPPSPVAPTRRKR